VNELLIFFVLVFVLVHENNTGFSSASYRMDALPVLSEEYERTEG